MKKILIIAAHPDDEVIGCGGYISKYIYNTDFRVLFLGEGSTCRYENVKSKNALEAIKNRNSSAKKAMRFIGINDFSFENLPCGRFDQVPIIEINKIIEKHIDTFHPNIIFTHAENDVNNDHKITFKATLMASRPVQTNPVEEVYSYEVLSSSEWVFNDAFNPNYFVNLSSKNIETKWEALKIYDTEIKDFPFPRSKKGVYTQAMQRGMQSNYEYAEAFKLIRKFEK